MRAPPAVRWRCRATSSGCLSESRRSTIFSPIWSTRSLVDTLDRTADRYGKVFDMLHRSTTWVGATAREIAHAVRRGDTTATAVVADHLDSIRAYDRIVGAFREVRAAEAIAEAEIVDDQPDLANLALAGVPV